MINNKIVINKLLKLLWYDVGSVPLSHLPDYEQAEEQGVFCRWGVIEGKASFWKQRHKNE